MNIIKALTDFEKSLKARKDILTEDGVRYCLFAQMLKQDKNLNHYTLEYPYSKMGSAGTTFLHVNPRTGIVATGGNNDLELDMLYNDGTTGGECFCIEVKFHRKGSSPSTYPENAGALFNDLRRLQAIATTSNQKIVHRLLVYVTDDDMHDFLNGPKTKVINPTYRDELKHFYLLPLAAQRIFADSTFNAPKSMVDESPVSFVRSSSKSFYKTPPTPPSKKPISPFSVNVQSIFQADMTGMMCPSFSGNNCHIRVYEVLDPDSLQETNNNNI